MRNVSNLEELRNDKQKITLYYIILLLGTYDDKLIGDGEMEAVMLCHTILSNIHE